MIDFSDWMVVTNGSDRLWPFEYSYEEEALYHGYQTKWYSHSAYKFDIYTRIAQHSYFYYVVEEVPSLSIVSIPVDVKQTTNSGLCHTNGRCTINHDYNLFHLLSPPTSSFDSFTSFVYS